jgi:pterin-4a-carbinolamine dehydratase
MNRKGPSAIPRIQRYIVSGKWSDVPTRAVSCRWLSSSTSQSRPDPTAKRPNRVCDPYGQAGKPLSSREVQMLRSTIHSDWRVTTTRRSDDTDPTSLQSTDSSLNDAPFSIVREFVHSDFLSGSRFLQSLAAVAQINAHYPSFLLERRIVQKNWLVVSTVSCHTTVLGGLSTHDLHLAMVRFSLQ